MQEKDADYIEYQLINKLQYSEKRARDLLYGIMEIYNSFDRVYNALIPELIKNQDLDRNELQEWIWTIREEFRHIDYHVQDAELTNL